ncbi:MAG: HD domain-containing protein [Candidatus Cloacimonetes bacterium]|nr:HD domain-containing protein [Candidatus Cloacimonadota bacterium]
MKINKRKIINDPVFGFISIQSDLVYDIIEHPFIQRLRRIRQLGFSSLVFPGSNHTRFEHTLGAMHLMNSAIEALRMKGIEISEEEAEGAIIAILLHDIGHGPFSHALEFSLVSGFDHETFSLIMMEQMNLEFNNKLSTALAIFKNEYHKKFLHQLVSSQLDVDRLDYLRRDSFYSGVVEGNIGSDRIIKMLNVKGDKLVVEKKAIYSIEKFLIARRLMYWQVYLHKTVIAAEYLLIKILKRAKQICARGNDLYCPPHLKWFLENEPSSEDIHNENIRNELIRNFVLLDDTDIISSVKVWCNYPDPVLFFLSNSIINRKLFKIKISENEFSDEKTDQLKLKAIKHFSIREEDVDYFVFSDVISNSAYESGSENILILSGNGSILDFRKASDINLDALTKTVKKHFICYPKELDIN